MELYPIIELENKISFIDPRYKEYNCENPDDVTYKTPNYVLQGERVIVSNFSEMLRSIVNELYDLDSSIIKKTANNDECIIAWARNRMFSYDKEKVNGDYKLGNTGIYESTGLLSAYVMYIIRALVDKYDIEYSDFVYSAREYK